MKCSFPSKTPLLQRRNLKNANQGCLQLGAAVEKLFLVLERKLLRREESVKCCSRVAQSAGDSSGAPCDLKEAVSDPVYSSFFLISLSSAPPTLSASIVLILITSRSLTPCSSPVDDTFVHIPHYSIFPLDRPSSYTSF